MVKNIAVLMATYNGIKFIKEQIDSILVQENVNVEIFVNDDISTDGTIDFIKENYSEDKRIVILKNTLKFGGAAKNFYNLIEHVDFNKFDYISFSDQDDVWDCDKISKAISKIIENKCDGYSSNVIAFWENGLVKFINKAQKQKKYDYLFEAAGPGCTYVLDKKLALEIRSFIISNKQQVCEVSLHDWLIYAFARSYGFKWYIDTTSTMKYRQHSSNQIGANSGVFGIIKRFKMISKGWYREQTIKIIDALGIEGLPLIYQVKNKSFLNNLKLLRYLYEFRRKKSDVIFFGIICIFGIY